MAVLRWDELDRAVLGRVLPDALVVLPIGAIEQHGPHLPTGTDILLCEAVTRAGVERAAASVARDLVLAPPLPFGASDHHLGFGGTLSLGPETLTATLLDLARSIAKDGGTRMVIVNGHGGNRGPCFSASAAASDRFGLAVAYLDYWRVYRPSGPGPQPPVPGHAGAFETSLVQSVRPDLVGQAPQRGTVPTIPSAPDVSVNAKTVWPTLDGYTDHPAEATASDGRQRFTDCADALAERLVLLAERL